MSKIEHVRTPAIATNAATVQSELCTGDIMEWRVDVRTAAGAASASTCDVTIKDNVFNRTLLAKTGVTGVENFFDPGAEWLNSSAVAQDQYKPFFLANQRFTVTIANGTDTDYVEVWGKIRRL